MLAVGGSIAADAVAKLQRPAVDRSRRALQVLAAGNNHRPAAGGGERQIRRIGGRTFPGTLTVTLGAMVKAAPLPDYQTFVASDRGILP